MKALSIEVTSTQLGAVYIDSAEARLGPLADVSLGSEFYVEERGSDVTARLFVLPEGAPAALARGVIVSTGVTARLVRDIPDTGHKLEGPGATLASTLRGMPGFKSHGLPQLSPAWLAAIVTAASK